MSDETTARDRIETIVYTHLERREICGTGGLAYDIANDVLRALAGAPTADVAALVAKYRARSAEYLKDWQDWDSHDGHERRGQGIAYSDVADELEKLAAAPEGVDAADEQDDDEGHGPWNYTEFGVLCSCGHPVDADERCTRPRGPEAEHQARVGALFQAADNLLTARADIYDYFDDLQAAVDELSTHAAPDGMDLEAQDEIADQLAAAQAANRRVRAVLDRPEDPFAQWPQTRAELEDEIRDALDGDTTEES